MINEFVLLLQIMVIALTSLVALRIGKEALVTFSAVLMVLANLFVIKQTMLFGLHATTADAFAVGSLLSLNLLQEFFDRSVAKKTIAITFLMLVFYAIMARAHLVYVPSVVDQAHSSFVPILSMAPYLVLASVVVFLMAQVVDLILYGVLQKVMVRWLVLRNYLALLISQLVDTTLFALVLVWLGIVTNLWQVVLVSFAIKSLITLVATPLIMKLAQRHART